MVGRALEPSAEVGRFPPLPSGLSSVHPGMLTVDAVVIADMNSNVTHLQRTWSFCAFRKEKATVTGLSRLTSRTTSPFRLKGPKYGRRTFIIVSMLNPTVEALSGLGEGGGHLCPPSNILCYSFVSVRPVQLPYNYVE